METMSWPRIQVEYHGSARRREIISLEAAAKRFKLDKREIGWLQRGEIAGTSLNRHPGGDAVYMIHRYTLDDALRDGAGDLLRELDCAAHECANATCDDLERLKDLAQGWAKLVAKYKA